MKEEQNSVLSKLSVIFYKKRIVTHHPTSEHQCTAQWFDFQPKYAE